MNSVLRPGQAGTVESSDIMIIIAPANPGEGIVVELVSPLSKQYGKQIHLVIKETLLAYGITEALVHANDKGALDCTIKARVIAAIERATAKEGVQG